MERLNRSRQAFVGCAACLAVLGTVRPAMAQSYGLPIVYKMDNAPMQAPDPFCLALGDINNDGDADLAVGCQFEKPVVYIYRNLGQPGSVWLGFDDPTLHWASCSGFVPESPGLLAGMTFAHMSVDSNPPDAWLDLVVVNSDHACVMIFLNQGNGQFTEHVFPSLTSTVVFPVGVAVADWDNNGRNDIAISGFVQDAGTDRPALGINWGQSNGSFSTTTVVATGETGRGWDLDTGIFRLGTMGPMAPTTIPDLVMSNQDRPRIHIFKDAPGTAFTVNNWPSVPSLGIAAAKLSTDLLDDVGTTRNDLNQARWLKGLGLGQVQLQDTIYAAPPNPGGIASGNLNCNDSRIDLVCVNFGDGASWGNMSNFVNTGNDLDLGGLRYDFSLGVDRPRPRRVIVGDLNNDGLDDIITSNMGDAVGRDFYESISVLLQLPCQ